MTRCVSAQTRLKIISAPFNLQTSASGAGPLTASSIDICPPPVPLIAARVPAPRLWSLRTLAQISAGCLVSPMRVHPLDREGVLSSAESALSLVPQEVIYKDVSAKQLNIGYFTVVVLLINFFHQNKLAVTPTIDAVLLQCCKKGFCECQQEFTGDAPWKICTCWYFLCLYFFQTSACVTI